MFFFHLKDCQEGNTRSLPLQAGPTFFFSSFIDFGSLRLHESTKWRHSTFPSTISICLLVFQVFFLHFLFGNCLATLSAQCTQNLSFVWSYSACTQPLQHNKTISPSQMCLAYFNPPQGLGQLISIHQQHSSTYPPIHRYHQPFTREMHVVL